MITLKTYSNVTLSYLRLCLNTPFLFFAICELHAIYIQETASLTIVTVHIISMKAACSVS